MGDSNQIFLRRAIDSDLLFFFLLRNEPSVRIQSFNSKAISLSCHRKWFLGKSKDPNSHLFVAVTRGKSVGQIRIDVRGTEGEVHIALLPEHRGKGYAPLVIHKLCEYAFGNISRLHIISAHIKVDNIASRKSFARAGFIAKGVVHYKGQECVEMVIKREMRREDNFRS